jgi:hypothetical protein
MTLPFTRCARYVVNQSAPEIRWFLYAGTLSTLNPTALLTT